MTEHPHRARLVLVGAVLLAYANSFRGAYQFDDWSVIVADPRVQSLAAWWRAMPGIRPLLKLSYAANHALGGIAGFHLVNLGVHLVNTLLVHAIFRRLAPADGEDRGRGDGAALVAAAVFGLHPVQTEAVTYLSGRSTSLAAALALASVRASVVGRERGRPVLAHLLSPSLLALSLGVKEAAFVVPAVIAVLAAHGHPRGATWRRAIGPAIPHLAVVAAAAAAFAASPTYRGMVAASAALRAPWHNVLTQLHGVAWLAGQVIRPDLLDADPTIAAATALDGRAALAAAGLAITAGAGLVLLRRGSPAGAALLWSVLWLATPGWIVPRFEAANDRQLYLALPGLAYAAAYVALAATTTAARRRWAVAALLAVLAAATLARNEVYRDELRFWRDAAAKSPGNARARNNLAVALATAGRTAEAERELLNALARDPRDVRAAVNLRLVREGVSPVVADAVVGSGAAAAGPVRP